MGSTATYTSPYSNFALTTSVLILNGDIFGFDNKGSTTTPALGTAAIPPGATIPPAVTFPIPTPGVSSSVAVSASIPQPSSTSLTASNADTTSSSARETLASSSSPSPNSPSPTSTPSTGALPSSTTNTPSTSQTSSIPSTDVSRTSLIATATVLGALLAIALVALLFLIFGKRRDAYTRQKSSESPVELEDSSKRTIAELDATIAGLEKSIENRDATIRRTQAAALKNGHQSGDSSLGDAEIRDRFTALSHSINDWVLTYFKGIRLDNVQTPDVAEAVRKSAPNYKRLIEDPRSRYLVLRAVISDIITEAFTSGQFIGSAAYGELKRGLDIDAGGAESRDWDAMTVSLLEKSPRAREQRKSAIEVVVRKIDVISSKLAGLDFSEQRTTRLRASVENAASLATTIAKQPALYTLVAERPGVTFDGEVMEDALQETNAYALKGRKIQGTAFPAVVKRSVPEGSGQGKTLCVRKAQIIA